MTGKAGMWQGNRVQLEHVKFGKPNWKSQWESQAGN